MTMTHTLFSPRIVGAFLCAMLLGVTPAVFAAPGAHGPDGEHLDGPAAKVGAAKSPRMEAYSDLFELVATLGGGELSILIDRYATNEPLLNATVEVESGALKAKAKFHADHGDYSIDDAAFLKAISVSGAHPLVFTILAGSESDLLNGTLVVSGAMQDAHHHAFLGLSERTWVMIGGTVILLGVIGLILRGRRRSRTSAWEGRA
jgi:hypothetical protein